MSDLLSLNRITRSLISESFKNRKNEYNMRIFLTGLDIYSENVPITMI